MARPQEQPDDNEPKQRTWLGTTEAADELGIVPRTLYGLIDDGQLPAYKMGCVIQIKAADVEDFLEADAGPAG